MRGAAAACLPTDFKGSGCVVLLCGSHRDGAGQAFSPRLSPSGTNFPCATACLRGGCRVPAWVPCKQRSGENGGRRGEGRAGGKKSLRRLKMGR